MAEVENNWPTELRVVAGGRALRITFEDGRSFELAAEYLRVSSPSAEVQGHSPADKQVVTGKRQVAISGADPVGHYAVKLRFTDGHDTGLFTWSYLHQLGVERDTLWTAYLSGLREKGLSRD